MSILRRNFAVAIGINAYHPENGIKPLGTAVNDARAIATLLKKEYEYQKIWELFDQQASYEGITTLLKKTLPQTVGQDDRLLFYFAGHGITRKGKDGSPAGYLIPQDAKINLQTAEPDQSENFLPMPDLYEAFKVIDCHHLLVILDCCYAGMFRWATRKLIPIPERIHREHYDRFMRFPAWQVLASAAHDQEALDLVTDQRGVIPGTNHSPFAMAFLQGLGYTDGKLNADMTGDGIITTPELYLYVDQSVNQWTNEQQTPGFWSLRSEYDRGEFIFTMPGFDPNKSLTPAPPLDTSNNPYRGLESFEERHARFFFGRKALIEDLYEHRLAQDNRSLTIVLGASGSGKSSLVKAGLIPYLREKQQENPQLQQWKILDPMRPGDSPFTILARTLLPITHPNLIPQLEQLQELDQVFQTQVESEIEAERNHQSHQSHTGTGPNAAFIQLSTAWKGATSEAKLLLVIDYFEELRNRYLAQELVELRTAIQGAVEQLAKNLQNDRQYLSQVIAIWSQTQPNTKLLLVIDQFEELITMAQEHQNSQQTEKEWQPFLAMLKIALASQPHRFHAVLTLRSDFEPRFLESELKQDWSEARFPVRAMNTDELRQSIEGPALKQALYFEPPDLVGRLIDEVGQMPGALPLLSFTLSELYIKLAQRWQESDSTERALKLEDYIDLGGVAGSLTRRATEEYEQIGADRALGKAGQKTMRRVMLRMVKLEEGEATQKRVPESELVYPNLGENGRVKQVIEQLVKSRLLVRGQEAGKPYIELAHDFLVQGWDKLQTWIKDAQGTLILQQRLTLAASDWIKNEQQNEYLWIRDPRLPALEKLLESENNNWLNQLEIEFVQNSLRQKQDELERAERQRDEAERQRQAAEWEQYVAAIQLAQFLIQSRRYTEAEDALLNTPEYLRNWEWGYLMMYIHPELLCVSGSYAEFNPDTSHFLTIVNDDKESLPRVELWKTDTGQRIGVLSGHFDKITAAHFSPSGKYILTASRDKTARLWNAETGQQIDVIFGHSIKIDSVEFSKDENFIITRGYGNVGNETQEAKIWKIELEDRASLLLDFSTGVRSLEISSDSTRILNILDGRLIQWDTKTGNKLSELHLEQSKVHKAHYSPNSKVIVTISSKQNTETGYFTEETIATLWDSVTYEKIVNLASFDEAGQVSNFPMNSDLYFSLDGSYLVEFCTKKLRVWDARSGSSIYQLAGHTANVDHLEFSQDGKSLITFSSQNEMSINPNAENPDDWAKQQFDTRVKVWDVATGKELASLNMHMERVTHACFNPNNTQLATASRDRNVIVWGSQSPLILSGHSKVVKCAQFSLDGSRLLTASSDGTTKLWDVTSRRIQVVWQGYGGRAFRFVEDANLNSDGTQLLTLCLDGTATVWDVQTGYPLKAYWGADANDRKIWNDLLNQLSPSGSKELEFESSRQVSERIIDFEKKEDTAAESGLARISDAASGRELIQIIGHPRLIIQSYQLNPEETQLRTGSGLFKVAIKNSFIQIKALTKRGSKTFVASDTWGNIKSIELTPDRKHILVKFDDMIVEFWNLIPWKLIDLIDNSIIDLVSENSVTAWKASFLYWQQENYRRWLKMLPKHFLPLTYHLVEKLANLPIEAAGFLMLQALVELNAELETQNLKTNQIYEELAVSTINLYHACAPIELGTSDNNLPLMQFLVDLIQNVYSRVTPLIAIDTFFAAVPDGYVCNQLDVSNLVVLKVVADQIVRIGMQDEALSLLKRALASTYLVVNSKLQDDLMSKIRNLGGTLPEPPSPQIVFLSDNLTIASRPNWYEPEGRVNHTKTKSWNAATDEQRAAVFKVIEHDSNSYLDRVAPMPDLTIIKQRIYAQLPERLPVSTPLMEVVGSLLKNIELTVFNN